MILSKSDRFLVSSTKLLGLFTACFYIFFTLIPDSHSVIVLYPFVSIWQIGLILPVFWLLLLLWQGKVLSLGNGLDWLVSLAFLGIVISTTFAQFQQPAIWNGWIACCYLAAIYTLNAYLTTDKLRYQVLVKYGYISLAFIILSLYLWTTQTLLPELNRIATLKQKGINLSFNFSVVELRNWAPIGHQNYVAGYLLLAIPVLVGLSIVVKGKQRWLWMLTVILGLVDLYTTSSKGGWLGLIVVCIVGFFGLLFFSAVSRLWLVLFGLSTSAVLFFLILTNNRLSNFIQALISGQGGKEFAYRNINAVVGWEMGVSHLLSGIGLGGVTLLYQKYRPFWAGRESELIFQLHSTPVQLWAEMGIWAIALIVGVVAFLIFAAIKLLRNKITSSSTNNILAWSICASFLGYGVMSFTDYQLDNVCISGTLVLFIACLAGILKDDVHQERIGIEEKRQKYLSWVGSGMTLAAISWLVVVHHAWQLSYQGFQALAKENIPTFVSKLTQANRLAPWEPYYPYQLAWNMGDLARVTKDSHQRQQLAQESIQWFKTAIQVSPYREFGYSNLGWLLLNQNSLEAAQAFATAAQLVPAKRGVFLGLGLSLLPKSTDLAVEAFALEVLREPLLITSPIWRRSQQLKSVYPQLVQNLTAKYDRILQHNPQNQYFRRCRGSLHWWLSDMAAAKQDWQPKEKTIESIILKIDTEDQLKQQISVLSPKSPLKLLFDSWFNPEQRSQLLQQAWLKRMKTEIEPQLLQQMSVTMSQSSSFAQWLKYKSPTVPYRRQRQGFGVVSRHIDGAIPTDYFLVVENTAIATWFTRLFPSPAYIPEVDRILQFQRDALLDNLSEELEVRNGKF